MNSSTPPADGGDSSDPPVALIVEVGAYRTQEYARWGASRSALVRCPFGCKVRHRVHISAEVRAEYGERLSPCRRDNGQQSFYRIVPSADVIEVMLRELADRARDFALMVEAYVPTRQSRR